MEIRQEESFPMTAKIKLTLCAGGVSQSGSPSSADRFFGPGVCELLERIRETGSIQGAAARMEMSYTKAWKILNHAEEEMGTELITRVSGGRNGGSSTLTEAGEEAVREFREMEAKLAAYADELLKARRHSFNGGARG